MLDMRRVYALESSILLVLISMHAVLSITILSMTGGHGLGGAYGHISKLLNLSFPHQRKVHTEGLLGHHALCMLGRILAWKWDIMNYKLNISLIFIAIGIMFV